jgi:hypothetical protein
MNSMNQDKDSDEYKKIVLECGNCHHKDILIKFLKNIEYKSAIYDEAAISFYPRKRKPYYTYPYTSQIKAI